MENYQNKLLDFFVEGKSEEEAEVLIEKAYDGIEALLTLCGEDINRDGLLETPYRFIKAFSEYSQGYRENPDLHLRKTFDVDSSDIVLIKDIAFDSMCEHHLARFNGMAHIAYIPDKKIAGLSKFGRLVDGYAKRFQVQERLTKQLADAIEAELAPLGTAVILEASHSCMCARGVQKSTAFTTTSVMRGLFQTDASAKQELMMLIKGFS